ncbi:hypothetical protein AB0A73_01395 [Glycomyces sp. NPDC047369]
MDTETQAPRGTLGHRIAWATAPLAVALVAAGIYNGWVAPMDDALGLIFDFAALWAAVATALLTRNRALKLTALAAAPVLWVVSFYDWFGYMWTGSLLAWTEYFVGPIFFVLMAMPPCWLLLAVWRRAGSGPSSLLAEAGGLAVLAMSLFVLTIYISTAVDPGDPTVWLVLVYGAAAALLALAARRRPQRRVAYGFLAILLAALAAGSHWLFYSPDPEAYPPGFIGIEVFAPGVIVVAAVAAGLQFAWSARQKRRTVEPAAA